MKILQVNNIDLPGKRFNGYDLIKDFKNFKNVDIKQAVIIKQSKEKNVVEFMPDCIDYYYKLMELEDNLLSVHSILSLSSPALFSLKEYQEADIIHFHMFHNSKFSLYSIKKIAEEKKVVITLHDPWFLTGRCVHFYECNEWKKGCTKCDYLNTMFPFKVDNCASLWKVKQKMFNNPNISIVVTTPWMSSLAEESPITKNTKKYYIPLGIDIKKFNNSISQEKAKSHFNISEDEIVLFFRAQKEFKGTEYIVDALSKLETNKKIVLLTCSEKGLLEELKQKYKVIDLGIIEDKEMIYAYNACDIFLMPSTGESFGYMAIEAMSCSKPVIIFNNTAMPSSTFAPECGVLVKNLDSDDLKNKIEMMVIDEEERIKRGKLGRKLVKKHYDNKKYIKEMYKMYQNVYKNEFVTTCTKIDGSNVENTKIMYQLNALTNQLFENNKKLKKSLKFNIYNDYSYQKNDKIDYSDDFVMYTIEKYCEKVYKVIASNNKKKSVRIINNIKKILRKNKPVYIFLKKILRKD